MKKIVVTRKIPAEFLDQLENLGEVEVWNSEYEPMPRERFLTEIKDATACLITLSERIDQEVFEAAPHLKVIANMAVGYDNIDLQLASRHDVIVTNTPSVLTEATAELGVTLTLSVARKVIEAQDYVKQGKWQSWGPYLFAGKDLHGATVGIFGMGDIGKAYARRLTGFNTTILYHNRSRHLQAEQELGARYVDFETLLKESDFVVCTAPLTSETENKFDRAAFNQMKNDAIFINIGRGPIVDEEALVEALKHNEIAACGLDVLREEPIRMDHPLLDMEQAVILPHIGSATKETRDNMIQLCVDNIEGVLQRGEAKTQVND
ncbi:D-glycerate dehydrogenase [Staphylococcus sp. SQ8-PEA]|uniref:D-glycerate dehydrogenase n=1 Tax=Staphylococcus marylandisciuri TaxID=2981529 RepID=A0ABT2QPN1_9STAP|nr:D-glycerate dehydrogenase [Staphylococcus marylandisciuri]MCU5745936.1 D-glycerate dehydrogenase [Staphylococcus marylandisciuri]